MLAHSCVARTSQDTAMDTRSPTVKTFSEYSPGRPPRPAGAPYRSIVATGINGGWAHRTQYWGPAAVCATEGRVGAGAEGGVVVTRKRQGGAQVPVQNSAYGRASQQRPEAVTSRCRNCIGQHRLVESRAPMSMVSL